MMVDLQLVQSIVVHDNFWLIMQRAVSSKGVDIRYLYKSPIQTYVHDLAPAVEL